MKKDPKEKILKYIKEKTGYLEELKVGNIFSEAGWDVRHSSYYLDRDEEKGREIDLSASKRIEFRDSSGRKAYLKLRLICEVKKSTKISWVIFTTKKSRYENWFGFSLYHQRGMKNILEQKIETTVDRNSSINKFSRIGITYCEASEKNKPKKDNDYSQIFKALTSSTKASEYFLSIRKKNTLADALLVSSIEFVEPTVIFNGLLYEAYLNEKGELELNEINHIPFLFNYISPKYNSSNYLIDVVTVKELPKLLIDKEKWINTVKEKIQE